MKLFSTIIHTGRAYREFKESISMMKSQRSVLERDKLIEDGKRISIDKIIKKKSLMKLLHKMKELIIT